MFVFCFFAVYCDHAIIFMTYCTGPGLLVDCVSSRAVSSVCICSSSRLSFVMSPFFVAFCRKYGAAVVQVSARARRARLAARVRPACRDRFVPPVRSVPDGCVFDPCCSFVILCMYLCVRVYLQASYRRCRVRSGLPATRRPWRCPPCALPGASLSQ